MDPLHLYSPSFLNLFASQGSQTVELESCVSPRLRSQSCEEPKTVERRKWTPKEDVILISVWLNTSKDLIVSTQQKAGAIWKRIEVYYNESSVLSGLPARLGNHCKQRWSKVNERVCKFVGCYETALKEQASGQNENDVMKAAHDIFFNDHGTKFNLEHAWRELRFDQKWCSTSLPKDGVKEKRKDFASNDVEEVVSEARPPGVKACKASKHKKHGNEAAADRLETISKQRLIERLLANRDKLSDLEVCLKNKLISEMIGSPTQ